MDNVVEERKKEGEETGVFRYLIVRPEKGGVVDLFRLLVSHRSSSTSTSTSKAQEEEELFIESSSSSDDDDGWGPISPDHRWVIVVSVIVRRTIAIFGKPMEWTGILVEFFLNLLSHNGNLPGLLLNLLTGKVVMPRRGSERFMSAIGHLDSRVELDPAAEMGEPPETAGSRAIMDLCMMSSKLAYENANVVADIVRHHWKMHFVEFFNCWNDYQKERSTQVFILCDKPKDASLVLISFRGTEPFDADDWSTDFDYSWYEIPKMGKVHMGFLEALGLGNRAQASTFRDHLSINYEGIKDNSTEETTVEMNAYYAVKCKVKSLLDEHKKAKFIVTGHSLGGALAILFPAVLLLHKEEELMKRLMGVYTFGQPRVGDRQLERFMEAHVCHPVPKYFRVVYCNDLVPRLPYDDQTFLYKHFGICLYYNSLYVEQNMEEEPNMNFFGLRYLLPEYLNAVWELIRSLIMGYTHGPEYKEGWFSILLRILGLAMPGISAHSPTNYVNSIRLGRGQVQIATI